MDIKKTKSKETTSKGVSGSPKKGGAGGKGIWGKGGADDLIEESVSRKDPNFDSDEEVEKEASSKQTKNKKKSVILQKFDGASPIQTILEELFSSGELEEATKRLKELSNISMVDFTEYSIYASMEHQPYERELVSKLLSKLYGNVLTSRNISDGFQKAIDSLEENTLDIPLAPDMLAKFIARATLDEIVPPSFLKSAWAETRVAQDALSVATGLVNDNHRSRRLEHIWGPGDLDSVKRLKREASSIVAEYLANKDKLEADRSLRNLNAPHFHFQVVRQALQMAFSASPKDREFILELLGVFISSGLLCASDMEQGFQYCGKFLDDTKLDIPSAPATFSDLVKSAQSQGILSKDFSL